MDLKILKFFNSWNNAKGIIAVMSPMLAAIVSMKAALFGLWLLVFMDLLTGIRKNFHLNKISKNPLKGIFWKSIKSYALRQTWRKCTEYGVGIVVIVIFETLVFGFTPVELAGKSFSVSELFIIFPAGVELYSIYENMEAVSNKNFLKRIIDFLPPIFKKILTKDKDVADSSNNEVQG